MALKITDLSGVSLVDQPPATQTVNATTNAGGRAVVQCLITEDAPLPFDFVGGTLHWNDGTVPIVYNGAFSGTLLVDQQRNLPPGAYVVRLEARNYRTPVNDTVAVNFGFKVKTSARLSTKPPLLYGPILPKDNGYPNASQWSWNTGTDLDVLASSVKMLLITARGERIMQPDYGTNVKAILFELKTSGIESVLQNDITGALSRWEPRVQVQSLTLAWTGDREVTLNAVFVSLLNQASFSIPVTYTQ